MKTYYKYEEIIQQKLHSSSEPDVNQLWSRMEKVLDEHMPIELPKRPNPVMRFNPSSVIAFVGLLAITTTLILKNTVISTDELTSETTASKPNTIQATTPSNADNFTTTDNINNITLNQVNTTTAKTTQLSAQINYIFHTVNNLFNQNRNTIATPINFAAEQTDYSSNSNKDFLSALETRSENAALNVNAGEKALKPFLAAKPNSAVRQNAWMSKLTAGLTFNFNVPVGQQELNFFNSKNKKGVLYDYLPALHLQYEISKKVYAQAELQVIAPQYASNDLLYSKTTFLNPDEKEEDLFKLNKLYYSNLPISVHYKATNNLTIGAGVQYSNLKQMVVSKEKYYSIKSGSGWNTTLLSKETLVRAANTADKSAAVDAADSVASSFKKNDLRLMVDVGYKADRFSLGLKYTMGTQKFYDQTASPDPLPAAGRNTGVQVYLRYDLFGKKK